MGWDYAEDFIWPNTDTLYIIGKGILLFLFINEKLDLFHTPATVCNWDIVCPSHFKRVKLDNINQFDFILA